MILRQVAQRIENLDRAVAFYNQILGVEPVAVFNPPGFAFYKLGQTRLFLDVNAPSSLIYLEVPSVRVAIDELRSRGIKVLSEPHIIFPDPNGVFDAPGDEWLGFVEDSEGNHLGLMSREPAE
jgi:methylmalonyl-CoA/ethylmalonyl-CoA epimerase